MRALLARPARHQGVRQAAGEERGRAAGAGLHPEEAGGDASRQGEEKGGGGCGWGAGGRGYRGLNQSRPTDPGSDYLALMRTRDTHTHTHTILRLALTRGSRAPICVREEEVGGKKSDCIRAQSLYGFAFPPALSRGAQVKRWVLLLTQNQ